MFIDYKVANAKFCMRLLSLYLIFSVFGVLAKSPDTNLTGFANLGISYANSDHLAFRASVLNESREGLSWQSDTVVGLQLNSQFGESFDFVGQVILQDRYDNALTNILELAFVRYQLNRNWSAKVGRFSTNNYLLTDYRYVRHAQYWARAPQEMYSSVGVLGNMNGLQIDYVKDVNFGTVKLGWSIGQNAFRHDSEQSKLRINYEDLNSVYIEFQSANWRAKASKITAIIDDLEFMGIDMVREVASQSPAVFKTFAAEIQHHLIPEGSRVDYSTVGASYQGDKIELIAEYADYNSDWALSQSARTGYASIAFTHDDVTPFITLAFSNRKKFPEVLDFARAEEALPPILFQLLKDYIIGIDDIVRGASISQSSISLGFRWDFNIDWAVKFQFDHNRTNDSGSGLFGKIGNITAPREKIRFNVVNLSFSTTF